MPMAQVAPTLQGGKVIGWPSGFLFFFLTTPTELEGMFSLLPPLKFWRGAPNLQFCRRWVRYGSFLLTESRAGGCFASRQEGDGRQEAIPRLLEVPSHDWHTEASSVPVLYPAFHWWRAVAQGLNSGLPKFFSR